MHKEAIEARLEAFRHYEGSLGNLLRSSAAALGEASPTATTSSLGRDDVQGTKPLPLSVKPFKGKEGDSLLIWVREVERATGCANFISGRQRIGLAISKLAGRARE